MLHKTVKKYVRFTRKSSLFLFFLLIAVFILEFIYVRDNFRLDTDLAALFDGDSESIEDLSEARRRIGTFETLLLVIHSDSPDKNREFAEKFAESISDSELFSSVEVRRDISYLEEHALLYMSVEELREKNRELNRVIKQKVSGKMSLGLSDDKEKKSEKSLDSMLAELEEIMETRRNQYGISRWFSADDQRYIAVKMKPNGSETDIMFLRKTVDYVRKKLESLNPDAYEVSAEVGGDVLYKVREVESMNKDLILTLVACVFLLTLIIAWYFRSISAVFLIMLPLSAAILSTVATSIFFIGVFNIVAAFSFVILYGLGIDFGIHLLSRYGEEKMRGRVPGVAMWITAEHVIPSMSSGAITTAAAFFTLCFIDFKGFADYGLIAVTGIATSLVSFILFFPALIFALEKFIDLKPRPRNINILSKAYKFMLPKSKTIVTLVLLMTALSAAVFFDIPFEWDISRLSYNRDISKSDSSIVKEYEEHVKKEQKDLFSRGRTSVYLTDSKEEAAQVSAILDEMKKNSERIEGHVSLSKFVPDRQDEKLRVIKRMKRAIERKINTLDEEQIEKVENNVMPFLSVEDSIDADSLPSWIIERLTERDGSVGKFVLLMISGNYQDIKNVVDIKNKLGVLSVNGKNFKMAAPYLLLSDIHRVIHEDIPVLAFFALIAVFITLLFMFRSLRYSLYLVTPLLVSICLMFGVVWIFNIKLNMFNMVIVPTMLGTGIDSSIHIFHRYMKDDFDNKKIITILRHTGGAVLFSSLTTLVGFMSLLISGHRAIFSMGVIASLGISAATVVNLFIFPLIMRKRL